MADLAYNFFKGDAKTTPAALAPVKVKKLRREKAKVSSHFFFLLTSWKPLRKIDIDVDFHDNNTLVSVRLMI